MTFKVGLFVGREWSFPPAFIEEVNRRNEGVVAEFVKIGSTRMDEPCPYADLNELGDNAFVATVNFFNEGGRKGPFPPDKQTDLQSHRFSPLSIVTADVFEDHLFPPRPIVGPAIPDA